MTNTLATLAERLAEIEDLRGVSHALNWDQQTMMPPRGAQARAEALATIERISHERFTDPQVGRLLEAAERELGDRDPDDDQARIVAVTRRRYEKAVRVPSRLAAELTRAASLGQEAWVKARERSDFAAFAPHLERNLELARQYIDCFEGYECAYDVLLDDYDPGMRTREVARLFAELKQGLAPLIAELAGREIDTTMLHGSFPRERQRRLVEEVLAMQGFARDGWRLDDAVHPFATGIGEGDVRITTRWDETYFPMALFGAMHECGHGLYEAGVAPRLRRTPVGHGESLSLHESQSRLWENLVGRSLAFCQVLAPLVSQILLDGAPLAPERLFRAVNRVSPSFIRVEADETTYALHIVLRFELEQELIEGRLSVADAPHAFNQRVHDYLGLEVRSDSDGILQDVHWSAGLIGYFPTYALGNMIAAQLWQRASAELPALESEIAGGRLGPLREWLREHVHRHGSKFSTSELVARVSGGPIATAPLLEYLRAKLGMVYQAPLGA